MMKWIEFSGQRNCAASHSHGLFDSFFADWLLLDTLGLWGVLAGRDGGKEICSNCFSRHSLSPFIFSPHAQCTCISAAVSVFGSGVSSAITRRSSLHTTC